LERSSVSCEETGAAVLQYCRIAKAAVIPLALLAGAARPCQAQGIPDSKPADAVVVPVRLPVALDIPSSGSGVARESAAASPSGGNVSSTPASVAVGQSTSPASDPAAAPVVGPASAAVAPTSTSQLKFPDTTVPGGLVSIGPINFPFPILRIVNPVPVVMPAPIAIQLHPPVPLRAARLASGRHR
jgi:hypothetical protein